ncbi:MAG: hypothetical protein APF83_01430 [Lutibacter sp. BRH_c52]|nr:MAG: hypothetical protein APF83_01430 [Lutibacter sp. BRH_c52]
MYCKPKVNNGSVVIYYGVAGIMRFPTGVKISKLKDRNKKFKDWDYKKNMVRVDVKNATDMNKTIDNWLTKADDIVSLYLKDSVEISASELNKELTKIKQGKVEIKTSILLDHYAEYMKRKRNQLVERENKSDISYITYGTFKSTILDFEAENDVKLKISDVANTEWLNNFHLWLTKKRPKEILVNNKIYKFKTKGNLKTASVDKRFEVLTGFFGYLKEKNLIEDERFLKNYKKREIIIAEKIKTTLLIDELHELYNHKFEDVTFEQVKLLFLFSCLTGFRWKDIEEFDKDFISDMKGRKVYKHIASKTRNTNGKVATIPFCDLAIEILEKLDYNLFRFSNGYTNRVLHELLKKSNLFNETTLAQDTKTGRRFKRYELLTMHKGRDTFITNLIDTVPLNELMSYTSHEKLSTLQKYIDKSRDINPEFVTIFDKKA